MIPKYSSNNWRYLDIELRVLKEAVEKVGNIQAKEYILRILSNSLVGKNKIQSKAPGVNEEPKKELDQTEQNWLDLCFRLNELLGNKSKDIKKLLSDTINMSLWEDFKTSVAIMQSLQLLREKGRLQDFREVLLTLHEETSLRVIDDSPWSKKFNRM